MTQSHGSAVSLLAKKYLLFLVKMALHPQRCDCFQWQHVLANISAITLFGHNSWKGKLKNWEGNMDDLGLWELNGTGILECKSQENLTIRNITRFYCVHWSHRNVVDTGVTASLWWSVFFFVFLIVGFYFRKPGYEPHCVEGLQNNSDLQGFFNVHRVSK